MPKTESSQSNAVPNRAAVAVISRGYEFLTIVRSQTVRAPGMVCFPGGSVEAGETIKQALVREMQEELGIRVMPADQIWQCQSIRDCELNWVKAEIVEGEIITPNTAEVESFQWMTIEAMLGLPNLLDSNQAFFEALKQGKFTI